MFALLTTKTTHHVFFENQIYKKFKKLITIYETEKIYPKFKTSIGFEKKRDTYEKKIFFKNKKFNFLSPNYKVRNINSPKIYKILKKNKIQFLLVFGTQKIKSKIIKKFKDKIFNLHGGNPEKYRGLDSHYWNIYHDDFNFFTCIHSLNKNLDDGKIFMIKKFYIKSNTKIHQLRGKNTLNCIQLTNKLLENLIKNKKVKLSNQKKIGRYYSFMPKELKKSVQLKFDKKFRSND